MFLVSVAGVVLALLTPRHRRMAVWLALPVASYYAGFINVVLYNYDRFMLPICLVLSLFGGLAFDRWLSPGGRGRTWRVGGTSAVFACTLLRIAKRYARLQSCVSVPPAGPVAVAARRPPGPRRRP